MTELLPRQLSMQLRCSTLQQQQQVPLLCTFPFPMPFPTYICIIFHVFLCDIVRVCVRVCVCVCVCVLRVLRIACQVN